MPTMLTVIRSAHQQDSPMNWSLLDASGSTGDQRCIKAVLLLQLKTHKHDSNVWEVVMHPGLPQQCLQFVLQ